jgi:signal transduction histidine kinase
VRRRILIAILSVSAMAIVLFALPLAIVVRQLVDEDAALRVEREAVLAAREVPADFAATQDPVELPENTSGIVLGLYDANGVLVAGGGPSRAEVAIRAALTNRVIDTEGPGSRLVAVPVAADERVIGLIRAEQSTTSSDRRSRNILALLGGIAAAVLALGAVIGSVLAGRLAKPVRTLRDAAVELGQGNFAVAVPASRIPELDEAGGAIEATAKRLDDLVARERAFSNDASHQLRTPVAGIRAAIETELRFPRPDPTMVLQETLGDVDRLERTIAELLSVARTPRTDKSRVMVSDVLADLLPVWRSRLADQGRALALDSAPNLPPVLGNAPMIRHVLDVLLDNAARHGAGAVEIRVSAHPDAVKITVRDHGPGFNRSTGFGEATHGLGLPLARRYAEAMGGKLIIARPDSAPEIELVLLRESK